MGIVYESRTTELLPYFSYRLLTSDHGLAHVAHHVDRERMLGWRRRAAAIGSLEIGGARQHGGHP